MNKQESDKKKIILAIIFFLLLLLLMCLTAMMSKYNDSVDPEDYDTDPPAINEEDINDDPTPTVTPTSSVAPTVTITPTQNPLETYINTQLGYKLTYSRNVWGIQSGEADCGACPMDGGEYMVRLTPVGNQPTYPISWFHISQPFGEPYTGGNLNSFIMDKFEQHYTVDPEFSSKSINGINFFIAEYETGDGNININYYFLSENSQRLISIETVDNPSREYKEAFETVVNTVSYN